MHTIYIAYLSYVYNAEPGRPLLLSVRCTASSSLNGPGQPARPSKPEACWGATGAPGRGRGRGAEGRHRHPRAVLVWATRCKYYSSSKFKWTFCSRRGRGWRRLAVDALLLFILLSPDLILLLFISLLLYIIITVYNFGGAGLVALGLGHGLGVVVVEAQPGAALARLRLGRPRLRRGSRCGGRLYLGEWKTGTAGKEGGKQAAMNILTEPSRSG